MAEIFTESMALSAGLLEINPWVIVLIMIWDMVWRGIALWKAARNNDQWWYIALLIVNSIGILGIIYIFLFSKKKEIIDKEE